MLQFSIPPIALPIFLSSQMGQLQFALEPHFMHKKPTKSILLVSSTLVLLAFVPLCYPSLLAYPLFFLQNLNLSSRPPPSKLDNFSDHVTFLPNIKKCDIFSGEWVPNPEAPYYDNSTCWAIHEHQNCMKYGRPDSDFMRWRWKPDGCELPVFDPVQFLEIVRNKSMAFVGDSVGRNHMQSLICLLSRVEYPIDVSCTPDENFKRWTYTTYNFTVATFWTPFLVKIRESDPVGPTKTGLFNLYLDESNPDWSTQIEEFDYVIVNSGRWFSRPSVYYEAGRITGCRFCQIDNITDLPMYYGYRRALRTAFRAINSLKNYKGVTILRTLAPSHFEGGIWNKGGNCIRTRPWRSNETRFVGDELELYMIQLEEFNVAKRQGAKKGLNYALLDTTQATWLRPDGHPSRFGHWPNENVPMYNDCVHWCLPGPIDTWSDFLLEMLRNEDWETDEVDLHPSGRKMKFF